MQFTLDLDFTYLPSPVGNLLIAGTKDALHYVSFADGSKAFCPHESWRENGGTFSNTQTQLRQYFEGTRTRFDLTLALNGTAFQNSVWNCLATIPFGQTQSYGWMAKELNRPSASRAVGAANGANPLPIILPCHRVIGSNGSLTGFGGGTMRKEWLLTHEGALETQLTLL